MNVPDDLVDKEIFLVVKHKRGLTVVRGVCDNVDFEINNEVIETYSHSSSAVNYEQTGRHSHKAVLSTGYTRNIWTTEEIEED